MRLRNLGFVLDNFTDRTTDVLLHRARVLLTYWYKN
jgi:hypothetical protein